MLQTSATVRSELPKTGRESWAQARKLPQASKALASQKWNEVVKAIRENDARLGDAKQELAEAKARLAALDQLLAGWDYSSPHDAN